MQDIAAGPDGRPVILFASFPNDSNHRYHYAAWNGTGWQEHDFTGGGGSIATIGGETEYSGGLSLDHNDPSVVYTSRQHGNAWEIQRWTTPDLGTTFSGAVSITANSTVKNVRPVVPWGSPGPVKVLWMSGTYTHWKGLYDTSIQMLTTTRAPTTSRASVSAAAVPSNQKVTVSARAVYGFGGGRRARPAGVALRPARPGPRPSRRSPAGHTDASGLARFSVQQKRPTRYLVRFGSTHGRDRLGGADRRRRAEGRDRCAHLGRGQDVAGRSPPEGHRATRRRRQRQAARPPAGHHPDQAGRTVADVRPRVHRRARTRPLLGADDPQRLRFGWSSRRRPTYGSAASDSVPVHVATGRRRTHHHQRLDGQGRALRGRRDPRRRQHQRPRRRARTGDAVGARPALGRPGTRSARGPAPRPTARRTGPCSPTRQPSTRYGPGTPVSGRPPPAAARSSPSTNSSAPSCRCVAGIARCAEPVGSPDPRRHATSRPRARVAVAGCPETGRPATSTARPPM